MLWAEAKDAFHQDGSLRDIYVRDTTSDDWKAFQEFLKYHPLQYEADGETCPMPNFESLIEDKSTAHSLKIHLGGFAILCHFFEENEIELDIAPKDFSSQEQLDDLLTFLQGMGQALKKDVALTEENSQDLIWILYGHEDDAFTFHHPVELG